MKLLVCGGRDYEDYIRHGTKGLREYVQCRVDFIDTETGALHSVTNLVSEWLDRLEPELVITGGSTGADQLVSQWCLVTGVPCMVFRAAWSAYDAAAGPIRNGWMLTYGKPDRVLAFPGGRGTADMVRQARHAGVPVTVVGDVVEPDA